MSLKSVFKSNPLLYRMWFLLNKNRINFGRNSLPSSSDNWYFDGYPRSGNTFYRNLLIALHPELNGASHLHSVAGIKLASSKELKSIIIIRNPNECVSSFYYTKTHRTEGRMPMEVGLLSELLDEWINYYSYVLKRTNLCVITFSPSKDDIVKNIRKIENFLRLKPLSASDLILKIEKYHESFKLGEDSKESAYSSLPKKERTEFKEAVKSQLQSLPRFSEAQQIFRSIVNI